MRRTTSTLTAAAALITLTAGCSGDQSPGLQPADATGPLTIPAAVHATLSKPAPPSLAPSHLRYGPAAFTLWQPNPRAGPAPTNPVLQRRTPRADTPAAGTATPPTAS
jgi:hypothetical protein